MTARAALQSIITFAEFEARELKRSTALLTRAGEMLCVFLNGKGHKLLISGGPGRTLVGQDFAETVTFKAKIVANLGHAPSQVDPKSVTPAAQVQALEIASIAVRITHTGSRTRSSRACSRHGGSRRHFPKRWAHRNCSAARRTPFAPRLRLR